MLRNIFNALGGKSPYWETRRISADYGQSADFVSYRAAQTWCGDWQVYFCDYVPISRFARMKPKDARLFEDTVHSIDTGNGAYRDFRAQVTKLSHRCASEAQARAFLQEKEAAWANDRFLKAVSVAPHPRHFSQLDHCATINAMQKLQSAEKGGTWTPKT